MKIKEMSGEERPREKLICKGASELSSGELLAVLIRTGTRDRNALEVAQDLFARANGRLTELFCMDMGRISEVPGIKKDKAATLLAAMELGRRFLSEASTVGNKPVVSPRMVYDEMLPRLKAVGHEEVWIILLNASLCHIGRERLSVGGIRSAQVDVRRIIRLVLERNAGAVILVHNHPGSNPRPSPADIRQTKELRTALKAFDIDLVDHVIVTDDAFYSFSDDRAYSSSSL